MRWFAIFALSFGVLASATTTVTLYQGGFAYVEEGKTFVLVGTDTAVIPGLPRTVIPGSLSFAGLDAVRWRIVAPETGLESLLGKEVLVSYAGRTARGKLVALKGGLVLETPEGYLFVPEYESILSAEKPVLEGLPRLEVSLAAPPAAETVMLRYLARDLSWEANYIGSYADGTLKLKGIATLRNRCGVDFKGAAVSLVAGEVFGPKAAPDYSGEGVRALAFAAAPAPEVTPVAEYHRYVLPGAVDLVQGEVSVEYLPETPVEAEELYRFAGGSVLFILKFSNTTGLPLPAGTVRVYGEGAFLGEASMDHTPVDEEVELPLGVAFDLVGERTQTEYTQVAKDRYRESYRITVRSAKDVPVTVEVIEGLPGEWRIIRSSLPYEALDAHRVLFRLPVPAGGEGTLEYTVEYTF